MLIQFNEISPCGNCYEVREVEGLASQHDFMVNGPLDAQCTLKRKGDNKVEVQCRLKASLSLVCDRCLVSYDAAVDTELQIVLETASSDSSYLGELECSCQDLDCVMLDEPVVDLDDILRQQLYLALPLKRICSDQCRGICPQCGVNLNSAGCNCANEKQGLPFAILAKLKNKNTIKK